MYYMSIKYFKTYTKTYIYMCVYLGFYYTSFILRIILYYYKTLNINKYLFLSIYIDEMNKNYF